MENKDKDKMIKKTKDSSPTAIDVESIDLERMKILVSDAPGQSDYALERGGTSFAPTQEGAIKSRAFKVMDEQISMQMDNIMEQIQVLARQAEDLKKRRIFSEQIYASAMKFEPLVGDTYFLYNTPKGRILSMLSPEDFGTKKIEENQYTFLAKAKLLADCTWEILEGEL